MTSSKGETMRSTLKLSAAATLDQLDRSIIDWCQTHNYRMYSVPFVSNSLLAANHPLLVFPHPFYSESQFPLLQTQMPHTRNTLS
jgi:hypothetical protein